MSRLLLETAIRAPSGDNRIALSSPGNVASGVSDGTANTALVGAFRLGGQVFNREGVRIEATNSDQDDFIKNLITIRCERRLALAVYRPKAFCTVTSLST